MSTPVSQSAPQELPSCPQCKANIAPGSKACPQCGKSLLPEKVPEKEVTPPSKPVEGSQAQQPQGWRPKTLLEWTQSVANVAQVLALIVAGMWVCVTFYKSEWPGLEPHLSSRVALKWRDVPAVKSACEAEVAITLENAGKVSADTSGMTVSVWLAPFKEDFKKPKVVDESTLKAGTPFFKKTLTQSYLVGHFPPGVKAEEDLNFWIPQNAGQIAYVDVAFTSKQKMKYPLVASDWDYVCNVGNRK
jgi:hypothetical protein